ncbi:MAG TPA: glucose 1-dehydrogenase [Microthrixaceae bacterium]|nr:glucose 1-dehydrogenase [Microthrixaceae bacterium]
MSDLDLSSLFRLDERVVIVTGASSGLGDRFARVLHSAGATVVVAARRVDRLEELAASLGDRVLPIACDVADEADTEALAARVMSEFGRVDVLVNNAGYGAQMPAEDEPIDHFRRTLEVNLVGLFALTQQVARPMIQAGSGSIINIASILGLVAAAPIKQASYCAAKGAVVNLTRELAAEWARKGLRVNSIAPGWFPSEMTQEEMFDDPSGQEFIRRHCPMGRGGEVHELDGALLYLAGDASTYVTGHTLTVDGGWTIR